MSTKNLFVELSGKKAVSSFFGALSEKSADALEKTIVEVRKIHHNSVLTKNKNLTMDN